MGFKRQNQCIQAFLKKNLKLSKKGKPYIETKYGRLKCEADLVCFIRLPVPKKKKHISTKLPLPKKKKRK